MAKAIFLAWSDPVDEASEAEFSSWYSGTHIPQVRAAIPAISAVHRYQVADVPSGPGAPAHRYLAVYELDTDDVAAAALGAAANPPVLAWYQAVS